MTVERVVDGDTIEVKPAVRGTEGVRLLGVDTPETVTPISPLSPTVPRPALLRNSNSRAYLSR